MKTILLPEEQIFQRLADIYTDETGKDPRSDLKAFECWFAESAIPVLITKLADAELRNSELNAQMEVPKV